MRGLTLTTKEQTRIQVLNAVLEGEVTAVKAAGLMGVSERHGRRLLAAYRKEGAAAIAHGNRGREAVHDHVPGYTTQGEGVGRRPLHRLQPHPVWARERASLCHAPRSGGSGWLMAVRSPRRRRPRSATADGSANRRRGCRCRSTAASTTGWRAGGRS